MTGLSANFLFSTLLSTLFVTSCKHTSDKVEIVYSSPKVADDYEKEDVPSLSAVVARAKAEGADWSVREWKTQYRQALLGYKPVAVANAEFSKNVGGGIRLSSRNMKLVSLYPAYSKLMNEFASLAEKSKGGKEIEKEWVQKMKDELGVPDSESLYQENSKANID